MITKEQENNVRKWIDALRSEKYKQGIGLLRKENQYCCLGVAVDLCHGSSIWKERGRLPFTSSTTTGDMVYFPQELTDATLYLADEETEYKFAIREINKQLDKPLHLLNDVEKLSFNEIADKIEEFLISAEKSKNTK